jgi:ceramide glucosyltransferase
MALRVALVALALWTALVAATSAWALCKPWVPEAFWALLRRFTGARAALDPLPEAPTRVLLLRPCAGRDERLDRNLASLADARMDGLSVACIFAVGAADDPATPVAEAAASALRAAGFECVCVITEAAGPNHKVDQLARASRGRAADVVIVADSDVDLTGLDLSALVVPLRRGVACAWVAVGERAPRTAGDRASMAVLTGGLHGFALLARLDPAGMVGKLFAVRADALARAGGFEALVRHLGEDMELARRLLAQGMRVEAASITAFSSASGRSLRAVRDRYARWLLVVRTQRTALLPSYPLLFFAAPLQVLCALALVGHSAWSLAVASVAVLARTAAAAGARRAAGLPWEGRAVLLDPWLGDAVLCAAWLRALTLREVRWRGGVLRWGSDGLLVSSAETHER